MNGFDVLISKSLDSVIKENLGKRTLRKIENRLFEKYGTNLTQAIMEFQKLDVVLREFFGVGADGLEKKFFERVALLEKSKDKEREWIRLEDKILSQTILESFGDNDKKLILNTLADRSLIIADVLGICKIPQTSGYRKINSLIQSGLLIPNGHVTTSEGKKVAKYTSLFDNFKIDIEKNNIAIKARLKREAVSSSSVIQVMQVL